MLHELNHFTPQTIQQVRPDGSVKVRQLMVPSEETRAQHQEMLGLLYGLNIAMPHATGGIPGKQLLDNVRPHRHSNAFYALDLKDAFPSVDIPRLLRVVQSPVIPVRQQSQIVDFVRNWATDPRVHGLPLGAPASPFLFNLSCLPMDRVLSRHMGERGITYTRYLDDLTFSSPDPLGKRTRRLIRDLIAPQPGMVINHRKSRVLRLSKAAITITGISLYPDRRLGASPQLLETASNFFADIMVRAEAGQLIFDDDIGRLHGYHGAIHQLSDGETPTLRCLDRAYTAALGKLGLLGE